MSKEVFEKLGNLIKTQFSTAEQLIIDAYKKISAVEVKAKEVKTQDGTMTLSFEGDVPAIGVPVMDITSGTPVPLADGEYILEGGINVTVMGGMFSEVETKDAATTELPTDLTALEAKVATQMSAHRVALEKQVSNQAKEINDLKGIVVKMNAMIVEMSEAPIAGEISKTKQNEDWMSKPYEQMSNAEKVKFNRMHK